MAEQDEYRSVKKRIDTIVAIVGFSVLSFRMFADGKAGFSVGTQQRTMHFRPVILLSRGDPPIQELHLFFSMEPMLAVRHDGQLRTAPLCKGRHGFRRSHIVMRSIQDAGGDMPRNRMLPHIGEILP